MKKLFAAALMLGFLTFASAQVPTSTAPANTTTTTTTTTAPKMERKHRMHKPTTANATTTATGTAAPTQEKMEHREGKGMGAGKMTHAEGAGENKMKHAEGEHHKRTPAEEQAAAARSAARDKVFAKDAEGHDIHLGPNGGQYYINKEGTKTYLKADKKLKVN